MAKKAIDKLSTKNKYSIELFDLRVISPIKYDSIVKSILKTKRFMVIDGGWKTCGLASEIISSIVERIDTSLLLSKPVNVSLKECPAPSSGLLEENYYLSENHLIDLINRELEDTDL